MQDAFSKMHPFVNFLFFTCVILLSMFITNPICLVISFVCSLANAIYLNGKKTVKISLLYLLPTVILISVINPIFNHQGVTILSYFPWGNPLTLESILYGFSTAVLLASVVLWFLCLNVVMISDKFVFLFGKIIPSLSLILSMSLRFIPKFANQFKKVCNSQKCIGRDISDGSIISRIKNAVKIFSIMVSWALENSIETADSMKSRGYGLEGRTAFSRYKLEKRDIVVMFIIFVCTVIISILFIVNCVYFRYFPSVKGNLFDFYSGLVYFLYIILMLIPLFFNVKEDIKWKHLRSAI